MLSIFLCACYPSVCFLWRNVYLGLLPFFKINFVIYFNKAVTPYYPFSIPCHLLINLLSVSMNLLILSILYKWDHAVCGLCIWLLSLNICSRFVHVLVCVSTLLIFMSGYTTFFCLFIHSSTDKYLNCFYLLAIVNSCAMNIFGKVLVGTLFFSSFRYKLRLFNWYFFYFLGWIYIAINFPL